jgi:hypothetical protein
MASVKKIIRKFTTDPAWGFVVAIVVSLFSSVSSVVYIHSLKNDLQKMYLGEFLGQNFIQTARIKLIAINKDMLSALLVTNSSEKSKVIDRIETNKRDLTLLYGKSRLSYRSKRINSLIRDVGASQTECTRMVDTVVDLVKMNRKDEAYRLLSGKLKDRFAEEDSLLSKIDNLKQSHDIKVYKNINYQLSISILFTLVALVFAIGFRIFVFRNRKKPLARGSRNRLVNLTVE